VSEDRPAYDPTIGWRGARTWTPAEAVAALPLVRRIVDDLMIHYGAWRDAIEAFEYANAGTAERAAEAEQYMRVAQRLAGDIDAFRAELAALDVRVVRADSGLVAFRAEREGEVVPLYWAPVMPAPDYAWPAAVPAYGTSISWPSRTQVLAAKRSRA
jgi:hypothetical protein